MQVSRGLTHRSTLYWAMKEWWVLMGKARVEFIVRVTAPCGIHLPIKLEEAEAKARKKEIHSPWYERLHSSSFWTMDVRSDWLRT